MDESDDVQRYSLNLPIDSDHCFRMQCSDCGMEFKTQVDPSQLIDSLAPSVGRDWSPKAENPHEPTSRFCVYCGKRQTFAELRTDETSSYLRQIAYREIAAPMINAFMDQLAATFSGSRSRYISFKMTRSADHFHLPPRPIIGPECDDMYPVRSLCCNVTFKVALPWSFPIHCVECGVELQLR